MVRFIRFLKKSIKIVLPLFIVLIAVLIYKGQAGRSAIREKIISHRDRDIGLTFHLFNNANAKILEVNCLDRKPDAQNPNRMLLNQMAVTYCKHGALANDLRVTADTGIAVNNYRTFSFLGNAAIHYTDMTIKSKQYQLNDLEYMYTDDAAEFVMGKALAGKADSGMSSFLAQNSLKLMGVNGTYARAATHYAFHAETLWVLNDDFLVFLCGNSQFKSTDNEILGDLVALQFSNQFAEITALSSVGNSHLTHVQTAADGTVEKRDLAGYYIKCSYDANGALSTLYIKKDGLVTLDRKSEHMEIACDEIAMTLNPLTGLLATIDLRAPGKIKSAGEQPFEIGGDRLQIDFTPEGEAQKIHALGNGMFHNSDNSGQADDIAINIAKNTVFMKGKQSKLMQGQNIFNASYFDLDIAKKTLRTEKGLTATVSLNETGAMFKEKTVYLKAAKLYVRDNGDSAEFVGLERMWQGNDLEVFGQSILFNNRKNEMTINGNGSISFKNDNDPVEIKGETILYSSVQKILHVTDNGQLLQQKNKLRATAITLTFGNDNLIDTILAAGAVTFTKGVELTGGGREMDWQYVKNTVVFKKNAFLEKTGSHIEHSREIHLNLKTNDVFVIDDKGRSETVINK